MYFLTSNRRGVTHLFHRNEQSHYLSTIRVKLRGEGRKLWFWPRWA